MGDFSWWHWIIVLLVLVILLLPYCLFIGSIQLTLAAVPEDKREMSPGLAWLLLIPLFNIIWIFIVVSKLTQSFRALKAAGQLRTPTDASNGVGLAYAILSVLTVLVGWVPFIGWIIALAAFVLWIIYWVGVVGARREIIG
jgi:hypothetical protein